jgi:hypothetical protein
MVLRTTAGRAGLLLAAVCAAVVLTCTEPLDPAGAAAQIEEYNYSPSLTSLSYDKSTGKVVCQWTPAAVQPTYYKLYRALPGGEMVTSGDRSRIMGSLTTYNDVVGLENAVYEYELRAAFLQSIDTFPSMTGTVYDSVLVEGPPSNKISVRVGSGYAFTIAGGALSTPTNVCTLVVLDYDHQFASADFAPDTSLFSNPDSVKSLVLGTSQVEWKFYPWTLWPGKGTKIVWARLNYTAGGSILIKDDIEIRSYRASVKLRNETRRPNETMRVWYAKNKEGEYATYGMCDVYTIYRPYVDFGLSIFSDSTFADSFLVQLVFPLSTAKLTVPQPGNSPAGYYTKQSKCYLTGWGAAHNDLAPYRYSFQPGDSAGDTSLSLLTQNVTGSATTDLRLPAQKAYDTLKYMGYNDIRDKGRKEFTVRLTMYGRYFKDSRTIFSSGRLDAQQDMISYYDAYPPMCLRDWFEFFYPKDGSTIPGGVCVNLNQSGSIIDPATGVQSTNRGLIWDKGGADVAKVELVIASMPDALAASWSNTSWGSISYDQLMGYRHHTFPFAVGVRSSKVYPVYWCVDPTGWDTGWYLVAIITEDSFGNRGIAPFSAGTGTDASSTFNPQHWRIVTGSVGL